METGEIAQNALIKTYFGDSPYHEEAFLRWRETGGAPFNWAAFFIGSWWFFYKRNLWVGITLTLIRLIVATIGNPMVRDVIVIGISLFTGFMGNAMDYQRLENLLTEVEPLDDVNRLAIVKRKGKPWTFVIVLFCLDVLISLYLFYRILA
jgi:hypothetical protein